MSNAMDEQETTVVAGRTDSYVEIYTTNTVHLKKLRADSRVAEIKGEEDWATFRIPSGMYDPISGFKRQRRQMSEEERAAAADNLAKARAKRGAK